MHVVAATLDDTRAIAQVHVRSWRHAYRGILPDEFLAALSVEQREAMWRECVSQGAPELIVAKSEAQVLGFACFGASRDEGAPKGAAELNALCLDPSAWSTGAGRGLWLAAYGRLASQGFEAVTLWVMVKNIRMRGGSTDKKGARRFGRAP